MVLIRTKLVAAGHQPTVIDDLGMVEFDDLPSLVAHHPPKTFTLGNGPKRYKVRNWLNVTRPPDAQEVWIEEVPEPALAPRTRSGWKGVKITRAIPPGTT